MSEEEKQQKQKEYANLHERHEKELEDAIRNR